MDETIFKGTGAALITPFKKDKSIDFVALEKLVDDIINNNVDYLVVMGTTGESVTLTKEEQSSVIAFVVEKVNNRTPIMVGCGGNNTMSILEAIESINFKGIDALLSVSPYYNKPSQEGIFQHYVAIADASPVPVMLYNVPGRTYSNVTAKTTLRLAQHPNIFGMKEASGDLEQITDIITQKPNNFLLISGDDSLTLPILALGGDGVISVIANVMPKAYSSMTNAAMNGDIIAARKLHFGMCDMYKALFAEGSPAGVKAALAEKGIIQNILRLPLVPVSSDLQATFKKILSKELVTA